MKKGPFKLKSGNKPSMAQLSGVSPAKNVFSKKYNPFSPESRMMTANQRRAAQDADPTFKGNKQKTGDELKAAKSKVKSKVGGDVKNVFSKVDKAIQGFFNNPRSKAAGGDAKTYVPPKKGIASGGSSGGSGGGFKPVTFKGKKGDPYSYRTTKDGGYEYSRDGKKFTKATNKKAIEAINKIAPTKMKKKK